jgi:hypothetical protein
LSIRCATLLTIALISFPSWAMAQAGPVSLGVVAGANVADQAGQDVFAPHDRIGFIGGASGTFRFASRWAIQVDGLFVQKGGRENNDVDPEDPFDDELSLEYIEFPILLKFSFTEGGTRPEVFVGPSFAYELSCNYDTFPDGSSEPVDCSEAGLETRSLDVGVAFGADVEISLGSGHLVIDARGIVGLNSFDDSEANLDFRNRILALMVGYRFSL